MGVTVVQPRVEEDLSPPRGGGEAVRVSKMGSAEGDGHWDVERGSQRQSEGQSSHHCVLVPCCSLICWQVRSPR